MANLLRRFNKQVVGSDGKAYDYLAKITASGDFQRVDDLNVIITSWNNILLTPKRTYLFDPEYGSNIHKIIFEPIDETTVDQIKDEIKDSLSIYDSRAIIESIEVLMSSNGKGYQINIQVLYKGIKGELVVTFDDSTLLPESGG